MMIHNEKQHESFTSSPQVTQSTSLVYLAELIRREVIPVLRRCNSYSAKEMDGETLPDILEALLKAALVERSAERAQLGCFIDSNYKSGSSSDSPTYIVTEDSKGCTWLCEVRQGRSRPMRCPMATYKKLEHVFYKFEASGRDKHGLKFKGLQAVLKNKGEVFSDFHIRICLRLWMSKGLIHRKNGRYSLPKNISRHSNSLDINICGVTVPPKFPTRVISLSGLIQKPAIKESVISDLPNADPLPDPL